MCTKNLNYKLEDLEDILVSYNNNMDVDETQIKIYLNILNNKVNNFYDEFSKKEKNPRMFYEALKSKFAKFMQEAMSQTKNQYKKTVLLYHYKKSVLNDEMYENKFLEWMLMKSPSRDISGINQITVLTSPTPDGQDFSCKHDCFYCPNEPAHKDNNWTAQPRSYLYSEPAVQRANRNKFCPISQTFDRLKSLLVCGHKCDKLEFIIEGGTFTEYPKPYLYTYFRDFIYACNEFYNMIKYGSVDSNDLREKGTLEEEITMNKTSKCKIIGICIETRPDAILENDEDGFPWIQTLLNWGVTRLQLGVQHIDNFILKKINRGHTIEDAIKAIEICKNNCFKIDIHIMPDLPYSNPDKDKSMFDYIYKSPHLQPDQMKIYPCEIVPWTKIKDWYESGKHVPYGNNKAIIQDVLNYAMEKCPDYIRLPRVVRDIPDQYISGGLKCGNIRQNIEDNLTFKGRDIRRREIGRHPQYTIKDARTFVQKYHGSNGIEYFISVESYDKKALFGFCRLRIPSNDYLEHAVYKDTLKNKALIRELHVYGSVVGVLHNIHGGNAVQHNGIGKKLVKTAEYISLLKHFKSGTVVISGIGVRGYYENIGYELENNYMVKSFWKYFNIKMILVDILFIVVIYIYTITI
jgi:ELP3 family radical SAM enzyme/protein acetyltransferase